MSMMYTSYSYIDLQGVQKFVLYLTPHFSQAQVDGSRNPLTGKDVHLTYFQVVSTYYCMSMMTIETLV